MLLVLFLARAEDAYIVQVTRSEMSERVCHCVVLLVCVSGMIFLACACAIDGFLLYFLLPSACPVPRLFVTLATCMHARELVTACAFRASLLKTQLRHRSFWNGLGKLARSEGDGLGGQGLACQQQEPERVAQGSPRKEVYNVEASRVVSLQNERRLLCQSA